MWWLEVASQGPVDRGRDGNPSCSRWGRGSGYWLIFGVPSRKTWPVTLVFNFFFSFENIPLVQSVLYHEAGCKWLLENPSWRLSDWGSYVKMHHVWALCEPIYLVSLWVSWSSYLEVCFITPTLHFSICSSSARVKKYASRKWKEHFIGPQTWLGELGILLLQETWDLS